MLKGRQTNHNNYKTWIWIKSHKKARWNKWVFNSFLKIVIDCAERTCSGSLFQARGPAVINALSPNDKRLLGTSKVKVSADRKPLLRPIEDDSWTWSARYDGASPDIQRKTSMQSLYSTRSTIGSQWWSRSDDVTWPYFRAPVTSRIDEFRTAWSRRKSHEGSPAKTTLQ